MKTKLFTLLIALAASVGTMLHAERCLVASGYCGAEGDSTNLRWELGCDSVLNIYGTGKMADYIDSTMMPWYGYHLSFIQKARLSDSITHIGSMAFHDVRSVKEINLPQNLQSIGEYAISYCTLLKTIEIPSGVTSIDNWAFDGCENLRTIINHATTPQPIQSNVFYYYTYRSGTLYVPAESVELYRAAEGWSGFTNIRPIKCLLASGYCGAEGDGTNLRWELGCDSVLNIYGTGDMRDYRDSTELPWQHYRLSAIKRVELSEGITRIGSHAFESMSALDTVIVPKSVKSIGSGAFLYNELRTLALQEGLERIDDYAFEGCYKLWRVILPSTVEYIGEGAFYNCSSIHSFEAIDNPHFVTHDGVLYRNDTMTLIQYPSSRYDEEYMVPYRCDTICSGAFYSCRYLRSLIFRRCPNSMQHAFSWYDSVSLYVPCDTKEQFMSLSGLPERRIHESVGAPEYAVTLNTNGSGLVNQSDMQVLCSGTDMTITAYPYSGYHFVQWSDSVTDNPRNVHITRDTTFTAVFAPNIYHVNIYARDSTMGYVTHINDYYEYNTRITLTATPYEGFAFKGWSDEKTAFPCQAYAVNREYRVTKDAEVYACFGEPDTTMTGTCGDSLVWELDCDGVLTIKGYGAMTDWENDRLVPWYNNDSQLGKRDYLPIRSVVIEEGVTSVGKYAFRKCSTIVEITLPASLVSIGEEAFKSAAITTLTIPGNVQTIGMGAFNSCSQLHKVVCYAMTPPASTSRFFPSTSSQVINIHIPCGTIQAYSTDNNWKKSYWNLIERVSEYSVGDAVVLTEPTCSNNSTLVFQAPEKAGFFFIRWSDGNTDNPRTVHLETGKTFAVEAEYEAGVADTICAGDRWEGITIHSDTVIGYRHFFVYTHHLPELNEADYPVYLNGKLYYSHTEKSFRKGFAAANRFAPELSDFWCKLRNERDSVVEYYTYTSCGDTLIGHLPVVRQSNYSPNLPASQFTTRGKDFWVGLTLATNASGESVPQAPYLILSAQQPTTVTITNPNVPNWQITRFINPGQAYEEHSIPLEYWYPSDANSIPAIAQKAGMTMPLGLHIEASEDISVVAMQFMHTSADATTILPTAVLGADYYTQDYPPYTNDAESYSTITILAVEDSTMVEILSSSTTLDNHPAGIPYTALLQKGQTYYVLSQNQQALSGTHVACTNGKKIAVFSGNILTQIPNGVSARDCLYEQAVPTQFWGTEFVVTRSLQKDANRVRITAMTDATSVEINGYVNTVLNAGETYEFEMSTGDLSSRYKRLEGTLPPTVQSNAVYIRTSMPVAVYSYDVGASYTAAQTETESGMGDPAMVWIAPLDMRAVECTFATTNSNYYRYHFVNIVAPTAYCEQTTLNGSAVTWNPVAGNPDYSYSRIALGADNGVYTLKNPHGFVAQVYGFGEDVSYAYALGASAVAWPMVSEYDYSCLGDGAIFHLPGTAKYDYIDWNFGDGHDLQSTLTEVYHSYSEPGTYNVTATIYTHREEPFTIYAPITAQLQYTVLQPDTFYHEYEMCKGESFIYYGQLYAQAVRDTLFHRCDSVEIFTLRIADCTVEAPEDIYVEPDTHTADFTWPIITGAEYYTLIVWADANQTERLCTLTFNAAGVLIRIDFGVPTYAPSYALYQPQVPKLRHLRKMVSVGTTTLDFTITGLDSGHEYYYEIQAYDKNNEPLDSKTGTFSTTAEILTGIGNVDDSSMPENGEQVHKILINGQIFILRGEKVYTLQGQEAK